MKTVAKKCKYFIFFFKLFFIYFFLILRDWTKIGRYE
jgi:hypothetical protein